MNVDLFNLPVHNIGRIAADGLMHARDLAGYLFCRFFTPMQIAARIMIPRDERFDFLRWFRIVEDMLRRILFIEASAIATSLPPPAPSRPSRAGAGRKLPPDFECERLESWRPSFHMAPSQARPGSKDRYPKRPRRDALPSRPLALRMQAVLEALYDPHPYIQRLARHLRRRGLSRFRKLAIFTPAFYGRASPTLETLSAEWAPRFPDSS